MNEATFTLRDIKLAALDALGDMTCSGPDDFVSRFAGMQVLIESLQSTIPDGVPESEEPAEEPKKEEPKKESADFKGYGAKIKRELHAKLLELRKAGTPMAKIADASGGYLTTTDLYMMLNAVKVPLDKWEFLGNAIATLEENDA